MSGDLHPLDSHHRAPIIGYHRAPLSQKFGVPRQPNLVALTSVIDMLAPYNTPAAFVGLEAFSHIWISWQFHQHYKQTDTSKTAENHHFRPQVRPPRLGGNQKIGVFASRSTYRPSALGLSVVKLERIEIKQNRVLLIISGADMIDGTPIIDIKPYVAYSDAIATAQSGFAPSAPTLMAVTITESAYHQFIQIVSCDSPNKDHGGEDATSAAVIHSVRMQLTLADIDIIKALIAQDPRPAYRRGEPNKAFTMRYKSVDVGFELIESGQLQITMVVAVMR